MAIKYVFFDLDGTLLPMQQDEFAKLYFSSLSKRLSQFGYEPNKLIESVWSGTLSMIKNNGKISNEEVFWDKFAEIYGDQSRLDNKNFDEYYKTDFGLVKNACKCNRLVKSVIARLKSNGYKLVLATNPIFPAIAVDKRLEWAGLNRRDFEFCSSYENSYYCKPNIEYYRSLIKRFCLKAEECLMVGNDVSEDMVARELGMNVFLLTDNLINKYNKDISDYPQGNFNDLLELLLVLK